mgnify:CR=1 FL=1
MFALKEVRLKKGFTRVKLAEVSKVPLNTIRALESGANNPNKAKLQTLVDLAKALKCRVRDFYPDTKLI